MKPVPLEVTMMKRIGELKAENARLKAEVERLKNNCDYLDQKLDEELDKSAMLCGQVERLTKAGGAMAVALNLNDDVFDNHEKKLAQSAWNAAKEGKQS
jgi:predicted nuclease with TOPRIM domain